LNIIIKVNQRGDVQNKRDIKSRDRWYKIENRNNIK